MTDAYFDDRVTVSLRMKGRIMAEVSSGSVVAGQSEEALFQYFLPDFLDVLGKSFPHRSAALGDAAALLRRAAKEAA